MTTALPDGPRGQALAVGLTVAAAGLLWLGLIAPVIDLYADGRETLDQRRVLAAHMEELSNSLPELRRQAAARSAGGARPVATLGGATDAIAGAGLQERLQLLAGASGVNLASLETLPAEQRGAYRRIGLRVTTVAEWPPLVALLREIDGSTPKMLVDDLEVRGPPVRNRPEDTPLRAAFTLFAFRAGTEPGATGAVAPP